MSIKAKIVNKARVKQIIPPERTKRSCGHWSDWTIDLKDNDDICYSYCLGCLLKKAGLEPVVKYRINIIEGKPVINILWEKK